MGIWIYNFSRRILDGVFGGSIVNVNIRNGRLFVWVHGEWIGARDKQIARTAKRFLGDLFVPRSDSFPINPEKKYTHSLFEKRLSILASSHVTSKIELTKAQCLSGF